MNARVLGAACIAAGWLLVISCLLVGAVTFDLVEWLLILLGREAAQQGAFGRNATHSLAGMTGTLVGLTCILLGCALVYIGWEIAQNKAVRR